MRVASAVLGACVAGALLAACGTTVPLAEQRRLGQSDAQLGGVTGGADAEPGAPQQGGGKSSGGANGTGGASSPSSTTSGSSAVAPQTGPVTTDRPSADGTSHGGAHGPAEVGVIVPNTNAGQAFGNAFGTAVVTGDVPGMARAMVAYVNSRGGFAGHKVVPVFYQRCVGCDLATEDQAICTSFTQDHHVVAVVDNTETSVALASCLGKHGAAVLGGGVAVFGDKEFEEARSFWTEYGMSADTVFRTLVDRLQKQDWFGHEKVGLIVSEAQPAFARIAGAVKAQLAGLGHPVQAEGSMANAPEGGSAAAGIVLKFKAAGITRVVILDSGSGVMLQLASQEASQGYYPRVTVTSLDVLGTSAGLIPPQAYEGAAGIGWQPIGDGAPNRPAQNASEKRCRAVFRQAQVQLSSGLAETEGLAMCDSFLFGQAAYARAGSNALADFGSAVASLGSSYLPASTFLDRFGPGVYGGAAQVRSLAYDRSCSCFRYTSGPADVS